MQAKHPKDAAQQQPQVRLAYSAPELKDFGRVQDLTSAASAKKGKGQEGSNSWQVRP